MAPLPPITLEPPGPREVVDEDKAKEFVKLWTEQLLQHQAANSVTDENNNNDDDGTKNNIILCQRIRLSDKSYTAKAASVIATFLTEPFVGSGVPLVRDIVEVDLSDSIAGRMTEEGLQVLKTICDAFVESKLIDVNLSDNAIGQQGIGACRTALSKKSLERLALCNNGLSRETMRQVADILTNDDDDGTGCIASNMTKIHFYNNMSGEDGCTEFARILAKCTQLEDLRFSSTRAGTKGSDIIASALDTFLYHGEGLNFNLLRLDLCDNSFGNKESYSTLSRALGQTRSLSYLNLRDCDLGDDGVKKVCHALIESESGLEHLDLSGNCVEKRGSKYIADYIRKYGRKLKILRLEDNEMTSRGVEHIAAAFHGREGGHGIEEIQLNTCMVGTSGALALVNSYGPDGKDLPLLKKICLNGNSFALNVLDRLEEAFSDRLGEMDDNDPDGEADDDLSDEEDDDDDSDEDDDDEDDPPVDDSVDDLAAAMNKSSLV